MDTINDHSLLKGILRTRKYYWGSKNQFLAPCKLSFGDLGPNHKSCKQCWNKIQKLSLQWLCAYSCFLFLKHIISICVNANEHSQKIIVVLLWFMLHVKEVWFRNKIRIMFISTFTNYILLRIFYNMLGEVVIISY